MGSIVLSWYYNDAKRPCSVISNVQYKSFISLLTHFSQQSLHIISIRCYLLISPLTIDWNQTQSLLSLPFFMHLSLSLSHPSFLVILVLLLILFLICIRYTWNIFSLRDSFCSCFVLLWLSVMHLYMTKFLPSYFNYSKQQNGEYIEACFKLEYALNFEMSQ